MLKEIKILLSLLTLLKKWQKYDNDKGIRI